MADDIEEEGDAPQKASKMPLILGLVLALAGGGGGFYATWSGMILGDSATAEKPVMDPEVEGLPDIAFVEVDPLTITLGGGEERAFLRFRAQLEVPSAYKPDVEMLLPRVVDVLNGYLRALHAKDLEAPSALARLRAQMLRRVQIVTGQGRVNDLLIMEFVIN
jgi:flagellar FliL protein